MFLQTDQFLIYGKYKGKPTGKLTITGFQRNGNFKQGIRVDNGKLSKQNEALKYLWARKKIERLIDYKRNFGEDVKQQVIDLGLEHII